MFVELRGLEPLTFPNAFGTLSQLSYSPFQKSTKFSKNFKYSVLQSDILYIYDFFWISIHTHVELPLNGKKTPHYKPVPRDDKV